MFATGEAHEVYKSFPRRDVDGFLRISAAAYSSSQVGSRYVRELIYTPFVLT